MIAFIVRRKEIDTLNLAIPCKVNIQAPIPNIVGLFSDATRTSSSDKQLLLG